MLRMLRVLMNIVELLRSGTEAYFISKGCFWIHDEERQHVVLRVPS